MRFFGCLFVAATLLAGSPARAACLSPYQTVFACDIAGQPQRVEICAIHENFYTDEETYTFGTPGLEPELAFTTQSGVGMPKYGGWGNGLVSPSGYVYMIIANGSYERGAIDSGVLEVFETADDVHRRRPPVAHFECSAGTVEGDYRFFAP